MRIVSCFETADPLLNRTRRMRLDAVLLLLFFVVMYDRLTQNPLHEALGTASLLIVCAHLLLIAPGCGNTSVLGSARQLGTHAVRQSKTVSARFPTSSCLRPLPPPSSQV